MTLPPNLKERLFGAYIGCEFAPYRAGDQIYELTPMLFSSATFIGKLRLKSLAGISDENCIEVAKLVIQKWPEASVEYIRARMNKYSEWSDVADLLRSLGYALPFAGVSVETMVEQNLIELI